jgi:hypothetical protein
MRIRITRHTVAMNRVVMVGEVLDESVGLSIRDASELIRLGKAVEIPVAVEPAAPLETATPDPGQAGVTPRPSPGNQLEKVVASVPEAAESAHKAAGLNADNAGALIKGKKHKRQ